VLVSGRLPRLRRFFVAGNPCTAADAAAAVRAQIIVATHIGTLVSDYRVFPLADSLCCMRAEELDSKPIQKNERTFLQRKPVRRCVSGRGRGVPL
jgi:hypothetical protein